MSANKAKCRCEQIQNRFKEFANKPEVLDAEVEEMRRIANSPLLVVERVKRDDALWLHYHCPICKMERWFLAD